MVKPEVIDIIDSSDDEAKNVTSSDLKSVPKTEAEICKQIAAMTEAEYLETRRKKIDIVLGKYCTLFGILSECVPFMNPAQREKWLQNCPSQQRESAPEEESAGEDDNIPNYAPPQFNGYAARRVYRKTYKKKKKRSSARAAKGPRVYKARTTPKTTSSTKRTGTSSTAARSQPTRPTPSTSQKIRVKTEQKPRLSGFKVKTERL